MKRNPKTPNKTATTLRKRLKKRNLKTKKSEYTTLPTITFRLNNQLRDLPIKEQSLNFSGNPNIYKLRKVKRLKKQNL
jgi:hypothetical protein